MIYSFDKSLDNLPKNIPLFPLNKVLILPRSKLPLNLFENRYLHMFDHALCHGRLIGIIQPKESSPSNKQIKNPKLYDIGCAGLITAFSQTNDNRYEIILKGICRFKIVSEEKILKGFRRANICWDVFKEDFKQKKLDKTSNRKEFESLLKSYLNKSSIQADWDAIQATDDEGLVNSISMGCPFDVSEKQALLEAKCINDRMSVLNSLMQMHLNENKLVSSGTLS